MKESFPKKFEYNHELFERYKDIHEVLLTSVLSDPDPASMDGLLIDIHNKAEALRKKYGINEVHNYALWHALSGSTIDTKEISPIADDFPGEDSVAKFMDELMVKYGPGSSKIAA